MKRIISLIASCLFISNVNTQIPCLFPSSSSAAGTSVADTENWSPFHNPASLSKQMFPQLSVQVENRYIITSLSTKCFSIAYPTNHFATGLVFSHFGFSLYHEMMLGLAFARSFSEKFNIGVQFNYYTAYFSSSNRYFGTFFPQIGLNFPLHKNLHLGFHIYNPFQVKLLSDLTTKPLPAIFSLGLSTRFSPDFTWRIQADKEISSNYRFASALDYLLKEKFSFQVGAYGYEYLIMCIGLGCHFSHFSVDLASEMHPLLGLIAIAGMRFYFPSKFRFRTK